MDIVHFSLDPTSGVGLVKQLADEIRAAITAGTLRRGEPIPSLREIARQCGTSLRVPRDAVRQLTREGLLLPRRGLGTIVCGKGKSVQQGHVLLVHPNGYGAYYFGALIETIDKHLTKAGHLVSHIAVFRNARGDFDYRPLLDMVRRWKFTAALAIAFDDSVFRPLGELDIPYIASSYLPKRYPGSRGRIHCAYNAALPDFIAHCAERAIRTVWQVIPDSVFAMLDAAPGLRDRGIRTETLSIPMPPADIGRQESVERHAYETLQKRLAKGKLPDLLFVPDDFTARGVILALAERGIRFPEDVKLVSWVNRRFCPTAPKSLTRMEMDPFAHGKTIARAFLAFLRNGKPPKDIRIGPVYHRGDSFL